MRIFCIAVLAWPVLTWPLFGDAGTLVLRDRNHGIDVALIAEPAPLRVGPVYFRVFLRDANGGQLLEEAKVGICGVKASADVTGYYARVTFPKAGQWPCLLRIERAGTVLELPGTVPVRREEDPGSYWVYFAIPPVGALLFALNQRLKRT